MAQRKRQKTASLLGATPAAPGSLRALGTEYLDAIRVRHYSEATVETYETALLRFVGWCDERSLFLAAEVTRPLLERYQRHLFYYRKTNGRPLSASTQLSFLSALKGFFRWLVRRNHLQANPASELELPRKPSTLPRAVLTPVQADAVLALPDVATPLGLRDRALLETLYSTGIRRREAGELKLTSINFEARTVLVRQGKGRKDRLVPIGERALAWVEKYLDEARPKLSCGRDEGELFLSATGQALTPDELTHVVSHLVRAAGVGTTGGCHLFRHSMATAMLEGGADIRFIQAMLGHARLDTTQIYTQVAISTLQRVHAATHPAARLPGVKRRADELHGPSKEELLAALAAESEEEAPGA